MSQGGESTVRKRSGRQESEMAFGITGHSKDLHNKSPTAPIHVRPKSDPKLSGSSTSSSPKCDAHILKIHDELMQTLHSCAPDNTKIPSRKEKYTSESATNDILAMVRLMKEKITQLNTECKELQKRNTTMTTTYSVQQDTAKLAEERSKNEIKQLKERYDALKHGKDTLKEKSKEQTRKSTSVKHDDKSEAPANTIHQNEIRGASEAEVNEYKKQISRLKQKLAEGIDKAMLDAESKIKAITKAKEAEHRKMQQELDTTRDRCEALTKGLNNMKMILDKKEVEARSDQGRKYSNNEWRELQGVLQKERQERTEIEKELEQVQENRKKMESEIKLIEAKLCQSKDECSRLETRVRELEVEIKEGLSKGYENGLRQSGEEVNKLNTMLVESEKEKRRLEEEIKSVEEKLSQEIKVTATYNKMIKEKDAEINRLRNAGQKVDDAQRRIEELHEKLAINESNFDQKRTELEQHNKKLKKQLDEARQEYTAIAQENSRNIDR